MIQSTGGFVLSVAVGLQKELRELWPSEVKRLRVTEDGKFCVVEGRILLGSVEITWNRAICTRF